MRSIILKSAICAGLLAAIGSTYVPQDERIYDGVERDGVRLVTFAPILKHGLFPLADLLRDLVALGTAGTDSHEWLPSVPIEHSLPCIS